MKDFPDLGRIAVIGLGYVGLPLAVEFGKHRPVIGFDIDPLRVDELQSAIDRTGEVTADDLSSARHLSFNSDPDALSDATIFIVTVPTPIDAHNRPDLTPLQRASETVGRALSIGDIVIYESTVYPGATEEVCVPILEAASGLTFNSDFFVGYSPERINPGDRDHRLPTIVKVTSGSTPEAADRIDALYAQIITAGTFKAESIRVAEAAKVIENTQRDLNISLVNELAIIFNRLGIDTGAVLEAARTKWNFLPFQPGLVGGHCIGVDPYYLTHKAEEIGYHPQVILSGRRINDGMGAYVAGQMIKSMMRKGINVAKSRVLILGLTFKENCPDLRNTRVVDILEELRDYGVRVDIHDPYADPATAHKEYGIDLTDTPQTHRYDGVMLAVPHRAYLDQPPGWIRRYAKNLSVIYDIKSALPREMADLRL
ncbi:Vi polysaccharide biosynthesis UDP-N-acetylglucosamine C-6 dehydrogenase TviB [Aliiroseovarius sp. Z3]|uniref:Vi polysaccharide biosynthesis UDP-N-acetylglucosamine C-6 dehydrogenase TviB n=1 Tax=Aliiroseovarius sp. Z3 TaxID=2811402 RepID=UPI0023B31D2B|nr:Vi polysaccharide biosynthesis UDP-N-acetylglucosamine C-6 dehydrogenase TviB [Aliiroseovarius sp. Z3]MDE9450363.1 Vi polysaccharide biosynthesis UDP-N-acetylglucosamine C-6 dehydrogenase TviB [Aliiroseovarius sp. Z3]